MYTKGEFIRPEWCGHWDVEQRLPLQKLLPISVYYPGSGQDPDPIQSLREDFSSFVYADVGYSAPVKVGYSAPLEPETWFNNLPDFQLQGKRKMEDDDFESLGYTPFAVWTLLHNTRLGRQVSLLCVKADGVRLFEELYVEHTFTPACVAIIQPPPKEDWDPTNFRNPDGELAQAVKRNSAGKPHFLLSGGIYGQEAYNKTPCWPEFHEYVDSWPRSGGKLGAVSLWKRPADH